MLSVVEWIVLATMEAEATHGGLRWSRGSGEEKTGVKA
jgi:hypothetical protein